MDQDGTLFCFFLQDGILWIINSCWPERWRWWERRRRRKEKGEEEGEEGEEEEEEEKGEGGGGEGGEGEHVGDVGTLRGVQLCLLSPLLPIHSGAGSANQFNAKEKEIKQKHILKANISLQNILQGSTHSTSYLLVQHRIIWVFKSSPKGAYIGDEIAQSGQKWPKFCILYVKKYTNGAHQYELWVQRQFVPSTVHTYPAPKKSFHTLGQSQPTAGIQG